MPRGLKEGTTVKELIAELRDYPDNAVVAFAYTWPDHWRTEVVEVVKTVDEGVIEWSEYHDKFKTVDEEDDEESAGPEFHEVVVLRG